MTERQQLTPSLVAVPAPPGTPLDPRVARSRRSITEALLDLLAAGRPYETLTVSEIASKAAVTRKTFYAHFGSVDDIVRQMAAELLRGLAARIDDTSFRLPLTSEDLGRAIFRRLHERLDALAPLATCCPSTLFVQPAREAFIDVLVARVVQVNQLGPIPDFDRDYLAHLAGGALHATIAAWAERDFADAPDEVADFLMEMLGPVANRIFRQAAPETH